MDETTMKCEQCLKSIPAKVYKTLKIKELGIEVETEIHDLGKDFNWAKENIPKGWRLLNLNEIIYLWDNHKKEMQMDKYLEWFKQPSLSNEKLNLAAIRNGDSELGLYLDGGPSSSSVVLGVRWARDIKKVKK